MAASSVAVTDDYSTVDYSDDYISFGPSDKPPDWSLYQSRFRPVDGSNFVPASTYREEAESTDAAVTVLHVAKSNVANATFDGAITFETFVRDLLIVKDLDAVKSFPNTRYLLNNIFKSVFAFEDFIKNLFNPTEDTLHILWKIWAARDTLEISKDDCESILYVMARIIMQYNAGSTGKLSSVVFAILYNRDSRLARIYFNIILYTLEKYQKSLTSISLSFVNMGDAIDYKYEKVKSRFDALLLTLAMVSRIDYLKITSDNLILYGLAHPHYGFSHMKIGMLDIIDANLFISSEPLRLPKSLTHLTIRGIHDVKRLYQLRFLLKECPRLEFVRISIPGGTFKSLPKDFIEYIKHAARKISVSWFRDIPGGTYTSPPATEYLKRQQQQ